MREETERATCAGSKNLTRRAARHNPALKTFGERLAAGGLPPKAIIGAAMRKLVHIIHAVIKSGRPFDPEYRTKGVALQDGI